MQRWKKHAWTGTLLTAAVLLILAAVAMGAVRLIDLAAPKYRDRLAAELSESLDLPVTIGGMGMSWQAFRPTFELDEVIILDDQRRPVFQVTHIGLPFKWGSLVKGEPFPYMIELQGLAVALEWRADGSVGIRGVGEEAEGGEVDVAEILAYLDKINRIEITEGVVNWDDFGAPIGLTRVEQVDAVLEKTGRGIALELDGRMPKHLGDDFHFDAHLTGSLSKPDDLQISTHFKTDNLYADGWLAPLLKDTAALRGGPMQVEFSSQWQGLLFKDAAMRLNVSPLQNVGAETGQNLPGVNAELKLTPLGDGWELGVKSLQYRREQGKSPVARGHLRYRPTPDGFGTRLDAELDSMEAADLLAWLSVLDIGVDLPLPDSQRVQGQLLDNRFEFHQSPGRAPQYEFSAQVNSLQVPAYNDLPGVTGLTGKVYGTHDAGRFEARAQKGTLSVPKVFSGDMPLRDFRAEIMWEKKGDAWRVFSESMTLDTLTMQSTGTFSVLLDDAPSPYIDLMMDFQASDIMPLKPYIPLPPVLPVEVGEWLQASLTAGEVPGGKLQLKGRLHDFPYENPGEEGIFRIDFKARNVDLAYAPGWPGVYQINGNAVFKGRSMHIDAQSGRILDVPVSETVARIPDFKAPVLMVRGKVQADVGRQMSFLENSPLEEDYRGLLDAIRLQGPGRLDLDLRMPLDNIENVKITGDIQMQGVRLDYVDLDNMPVEDIRGSLRFSESGLSADSLQGRFLGLPTTARLTPVTRDNRQMTRLQASSTVRLPEHAQLLSQYVPAGILQALQGQTAVQLESEFDTSASASEISVHTDLQGMQVDLGEPFGKTAEATRRIHATIKPGVPRTDIRWQFADQIQGLLRFNDSGETSRLEVGKIQLGDSTAQSWPLQPGLYIEGRLPLLNLNGFPLGSGGGEGSLPPLHIDVAFDKLRIAGQVFDKISLKTQAAVGAANPGTRVLVVRGQGAEGTVQWQKLDSGRTRIDGDFSSLYLRVPKKLLGDEAEGKDRETSTEPEPTDPRQLPELHLKVDTFRLGDEGLGNLKINTQAVENGLRLSLLEIGGRRINVRGGGEWLRVDGKSSARLVMNISGNDIVGLLNATGYAPSITAEQADVFMELEWAPSAKGLDMHKLNGKVSFDMVDGSLLEVKPGAGRVLSLLSFYSLPRRLTLDFSDVIGEGTAFDKLSGVFAIADGNATTDDLVVKTPSSRIEVKGRVGLADQDYDQVVTIYPGVSSSVALAGAVLGGPVLGIGLWIAQELMNKPFEQVVQLSYRLTGSWDDPKVKALDAKTSKSLKKRSGQEPSAPPPEPGDDLGGNPNAP